MQGLRQARGTTRDSPDGRSGDRSRRRLVPHLAEEPHQKAQVRELQEAATLREEEQPAHPIIPRAEAVQRATK